MIDIPKIIVGFCTFEFDPIIVKPYSKHEYTKAPRRQSRQKAKLLGRVSRLQNTPRTRRYLEAKSKNSKAEKRYF